MDRRELFALLVTVFVAGSAQAQFHVGNQDSTSLSSSLPVYETPYQVKNCSGANYSWGACYGTAPATSSGSIINIDNSRAGYTGVATLTCKDGNFGTNSSSCNPVQCPAQTIYGTNQYGKSCSGPFPAENVGVQYLLYCGSRTNMAFCQSNGTVSPVTHN